MMLRMRILTALALFMLGAMFFVNSNSAVTVQTYTWELQPVAPSIGSYPNEAACVAAATAIPISGDSLTNYLCTTNTIVDVTAVTGNWVVKQINAQTTRSAFTLINGVLGTKEMARAAIGLPCDMTKPTLDYGIYKYAQYDTSGYVALCWMKP